ncbi:Alpha/Beta hydrolase protein [Vararia minispora EC-137]|uniref:Alpha/Beta hydrolase protein n=1 Tax=Vararia minispora EC-137 TaxID=1314806 RepID=A0ACB8QCM6_9AGAM|nr:Alpha/Beta hydrolase protein [Vararia minispora EC-137]
MSLFVTGVRHEGTPEGTFEEIAGIRCYVAEPAGEYSKSGAVVYFSDACGLSLPNNLLLCDDFARNGFLVVAPDLFAGDDVPISAFESGVAVKAFGRERWLALHTPAHTFARVKPVFDALRARGVKRIAGTGYCYGGRLVFDFAIAGALDAAARYARTARAPLLVNACEIDREFPPTMQSAVRELLAGFEPGFKQECFAGCSHGFAIRGDLSIPRVKQGKEDAFTNTVQWFKTYLDGKRLLRTHTNARM